MLRENSLIIGSLLAVLCLLAVGQVGVATGSAAGNTDSEAVVTSSGGVKYEVSLRSKDSTVVIKYENPTKNEIEFTGYTLEVDGQDVHETQLNVSVGESRTRHINITPGINVNQDDHTVTFSTYGGHAQFNFTREIESADSGKIPAPYISDVIVTNGTVNGRLSAVANVTLVNPSEQLYSTKLFVHTLDTDGSYYPASVRPGDSRTITVELLDERGSKIVGEARLFSGNLTTRDGAMDQVEFEGRSGEATSVWNATYEPVRPTWMNNHYRYHNDTYESSIGERISGGREVGGVPLAYLGVALLAGWIVVRKFR